MLSTVAHTPETTGAFPPTCRYQTIPEPYPGSAGPDSYVTMQVIQKCFKKIESRRNILLVSGGLWYFYCTGNNIAIAAINIPNIQSKSFGRMSHFPKLLPFLSPGCNNQFTEGVGIKNQFYYVKTLVKRNQPTAKCCREAAALS